MDPNDIKFQMPEDNKPPDNKPPEPAGTKFKVLNFLSRPWVIISIILALLMGFGLYSVNRVMLALLHSRPEVIVPHIEKKGLLESLSIVSGLGLTLVQDGSEFDETVPAGTILRQHPPSGMQVRAGRAIRVIVSKGGRVVFVPTVVGIPLPEAQSKLAQEGLQLGAVTEIYSPDIPNSTTISQEPSSGTVVTKGILVDLVVSKGAPPAGAPVAPDFTGQPVEQVQSWAAQEGIKINVSEDPAAVGSTGSVVRQQPIPGQPLIYGKLSVTIVPVISGEQGYRFNYTIPANEGEVDVRIKARNAQGEFEVYKGKHKGGDKLQIPMTIQSTTRARIYLNDRLKQERVIEP
ncbi:MAG: PASTA domain-containing protein [Elusimicrobia bacterium]|nr:PASTA domain-containing protein [Candidatus Obscuribacterium magneticum]